MPQVFNKVACQNFKGNTHLVKTTPKLQGCQCNLYPHSWLSGLAYMVPNHKENTTKRFLHGNVLQESKVALLPVSMEKAIF